MYYNLTNRAGQATLSVFGESGEKVIPASHPFFNDVLTFRDGLLQLTLKLSNYVFITQDDLYFKTYLSSIKYAAITTLLCLLIGYPFAYFMARARPKSLPMSAPAPAPTFPCALGCRLAFTQAA